MNLSVKQRLTLLNMLPAQVGSFSEMRTIRAIRSDLQLTADEAEAIGLSADGNQMKWDADQAAKLSYERDFSEPELNLIGEAFLLMESKGNIPTDDDFVSLYESFEPHIP